MLRNVVEAALAHTFAACLCLRSNVTRNVTRTKQDSLSSLVCTPKHDATHTQWVND